METLSRYQLQCVDNCYTYNNHLFIHSRILVHMATRQSNAICGMLLLRINPQSSQIK
jgi:hypothetical protein